MIACLFPGQGSQHVGMGRALYEAFSCAREVFQEVDEALAQKLSQLMFEGPEDILNLTENTQPALMAVSLAVLRVLEKEGGFDLAQTVQLVAGHSLGEYSALTAAGSLPLAQTAQLLRLRGSAMQEAVPIGQGAMAAILGLSLPQLEEVTQQAQHDDVCVVANDNCTGQVVISGHTAAVMRAIGLAQEAGAKRCLLLKVSAPFHSPLMVPAAEKMADALAMVSFMSPHVPLIPNVTARLETNPDRLRAHLVTQVAGRVRWRESLQEMGKDGITTCLEIGPGNVLSGLARKEIPDVKTYALHTPEQIEDYFTKGAASVQGGVVE